MPNSLKSRLLAECDRTYNSASKAERHFHDPHTIALFREAAKALSRAPIAEGGGEDHPALQVPCKHCGAIGMCPAPLACITASSAAIESLSRQGGEAVAELIHSADALTRMVVLPEGMQLGYGTHKLYASPARASEAGDWVLVPREPTAEMIRAGHVGDPLGCDVDDEDVTAVYTGSYRAMVAAALGKGEGS